eukprot:1958852-Pyramimonas_sp.AAC.1
MCAALSLKESPQTLALPAGGEEEKEGAGLANGDAEEGTNGLSSRSVGERESRARLEEYADYRFKYTLTTVYS